MDECETNEAQSKNEGLKECVKYIWLQPLRKQLLSQRDLKERSYKRV